LSDLLEVWDGDRGWSGEVFNVLTLGIFFALWAKIGIFSKISNVKFAEPLIRTLHGVIIYRSWAFTGSFRKVPKFPERSNFPQTF
jgi:hypothetical protein